MVEKTENYLLVVSFVAITRRIPEWKRFRAEKQKKIVGDHKNLKSKKKKSLQVRISHVFVQILGKIQKKKEKAFRILSFTGRRWIAMGYASLYNLTGTVVVVLFYEGYLTNAFYSRGGRKNAPYQTPKPKVTKKINLACGCVLQILLEKLVLDWWRYHSDSGVIFSKNDLIFQ